MQIGEEIYCMTSNDYAVSAKNISKKYGALQAVEALSFCVHKGEIFIIAGPNGAGKTTAMEMLLGLRKPDKGSVSFFGESPLSKKNKFNVGAQVEGAEFEGKLKVREILDLQASFYKTNNKLSEIISMLEIEKYLNVFYEDLSKGWKQRISIAVALVNDPEIIFFDEISSGLDPEARRNIWDVLFRIKQKNKTVILTSHYMDEADYLGDRIMILDKGKCILLDNPEALKNKFSSSHRVEVWSLHNFKSKNIEDAFKVGDKTFLYTNEPEALTSELKQLSINHMKPVPISLEDIYLSAIRKKGVAKRWQLN